MSIVEKALTKLQNSAKSPIEQRTVLEVLTTAAAPTPAPTSSPAQKTSAIAEPPAAVRGVVVDFLAVQRAGLTPQQSEALPIRNQFRRLKWPVLDEIVSRRKAGQLHAGAVMITSALPGEGKTFTSCNLALSMAREEDRRVILIDADVAKANISEVLGLRDRPGLTEFLADPSLSLGDILLETSVPRLWVVPAGKFVPHVSELLASARMNVLLQQLIGGDPSVVALFDSSPVLATNEAQVLSRSLSQVLLVVRAEHTPQPVVLEACDILDRNKISAVLNQAHVGSVGEPDYQQYGYYAHEER